MSSASVARKLNHEYIDNQRKTVAKPGLNRPAAGRRNRAASYRAALFLILSFFIFPVLYGFAQVGIYADISSIEMKRADLMQKIETEKELLQKEKLQFARLSSPDRIKSIAEEKLSMHEATEVVFIELKVASEETQKVASKAVFLKFMKKNSTGMR